MSRRFLFIAAMLTLTLVAPALTIAQDIPDEIATAKNSAIAEINADGVYVRSGGGDNYYPTTKLNKGTQVTVLGAKFDWLKIVPPQGSFSYVAKAFVDKQQDGTGVVNRDDVNVRAGSELNSMKTTVQGKLSQGQTVKILDEVDEYYKIAPPPDAFVYVNKQYVSVPTKIVANTTGGTGAKAQAGGEQTPIPSGDAIAGAGAPTTQPTGQDQIAQTPTTKPIDAVANSAEVEFDKVEAEFNAVSTKPIEQQPVEQLSAQYAKLIANPQLPESMRRIADFRVQTLKVRADTKTQFLAVLKQQDEAKAKQQALRAEYEEIAQQAKQNEVKMFAAVGTLRTSSIQQGGQMMYRLTDPATGRTVCYIRSDDVKLGGAIGQFIGVKGEVTTEPSLNMKIAAATEWQQVDPNQLYRGVAAQIVPPSMLPQAASATGQ